MIPETHYAKTPDGVYIAYQTIGDGPIDIVWQFEWIGNVDTIWQYPAYAEWFRGLASFSRLILHDRRGTGASSRNVDLPTLETRVADLEIVLDAVDSERPVLGGALEGGAPNVLFAASLPERVHSLFWWYPAPRTIVAPDYPFGAIAETPRARSTQDTAEPAGGPTRTSSGTCGVLRVRRTEPIPWGWLSSTNDDPRCGRGDWIGSTTRPTFEVRCRRSPRRCSSSRANRDRDALTYLASLLRQPQIRLFPGEDCAQIHELSAIIDAIREFVGIESAAPGARHHPVDGLVHRRRGLHRRSRPRWATGGGRA